MQARLISSHGAAHAPPDIPRLRRWQPTRMHLP